MKTLLAIIGFLFLLVIQNMVILMYASEYFEISDEIEKYFFPSRSCGVIPCKPECGDLPCEPYYKITINENS